MKNLSLPLKSGLLMGAVLIAFFLIASIFQLHTKPYFSLFNALVLAIGIFKTIQSVKENDAPFEYYKGFGLGVISGFIATLVFTIFFVLYATEIAPNFLFELVSVFKDDYNVHVGLVAFAVAIMGFSSSIILTLSCMQLLKNPTHAIQKA